MDGQDKGLILLKNKPLFEHVIERLAPQVDEIWISANRNLETYRLFGYPVISDLPEFRGMGPLAGLASIAAHLPTTVTHVQLSACDTPFIPSQLTACLSTLLAKAATQYQATMPLVDGREECALVLIKRTALDQLADFLRTDRKHSIMEFLKEVGFLTCESGAFTTLQMVNLNTPEDLQRHLG